LSTPGGLAQAKDLAQSLTALGGRYLEGLAEGAGQALARSLVLRLGSGDEAVGQAVGGVAGTVLFNVALTYATDGAYLAAKAVLPGLVTLVTATRDAALVAEDLARWLPQVLRGLEVAGGRLKGAVAEQVQRVLDTLKPLVERLLAMAKRADKGDDPAANTVPHGTGSGAARRPGRPRDRGGQRIRQRHGSPDHGPRHPLTEEELVGQLRGAYINRVSGLQTRAVHVSEWLDHVPGTNPSKQQWINDLEDTKAELATVRGMIDDCRTRAELQEMYSLILEAEPKLQGLEREVPRYEPPQAEHQPEPSRERPKHPSSQTLVPLDVKATWPQARLIENPARWFPRDVAEQIDQAQVTMNDLYREGAKYGDRSSAFMAMLEQFKVGAHQAPVPIAGTTLHYGKCEGYIVSLIEKESLQIPENFLSRHLWRNQGRSCSCTRRLSPHSPLIGGLSTATCPARRAGRCLSLTITHAPVHPRRCSGGCLPASNLLVEFSGIWRKAC